MTPNKTYNTIRVLLLAICSLVVALPAAANPSASPSGAGPIDPFAGASIHDLAARQTLSATMALTSGGVPLAQAEDNTEYEGDVYGNKPKNPKMAFLKSFLIPGWGQWSNGNRIKPFVFIGLEAAGWLGWSNFQTKGHEKRDFYEAFADGSEGWDYDRYQRGLDAVYGIAIDTLVYTWIDTSTVPHSVREGVFSHHIYPDGNGAIDKDQTYYENIGKYDQFSFGWRDYNGGTEPTSSGDTVGVSFITPKREEYVGLRDGANKEFNKASTLLILTIGNHLISAFEAALGARSYNRALDQFGKVDTDLRFTRNPVTGEFTPKFTISYKF